MKKSIIEEFLLGNIGRYDQVKSVVNTESVCAKIEYFTNLLSVEDYKIFEELIDIMLANSSSSQIHYYTEGFVLGLSIGQHICDLFE